MHILFNKNINISCKIYPDKDYLIFEEYYNEKYRNLNALQNLQMIVKTIKFKLKMKSQLN